MVTASPRAAGRYIVAACIAAALYGIGSGQLVQGLTLLLLWAHTLGLANQGIQLGSLQCHQIGSHWGLLVVALFNVISGCADTGC